MKKTDCKTIQLDKGVINLYDFGEVKLHAYKTNDFLSDEVFILEKGGEAFVLELPCFTDNIRELAGYLDSRKVNVTARFASYHMAGASFLPGVPVYATKKSDEYGHSGGGRALIDRFAGTFGDSFDASIVAVTNVIESGPVTLAGIRMNIVETADAFDVELPEISAVYTHMLGNDCHSIVAGTAHADGMIAQLRGYLDRGYGLILSSHYTPEDLKDVETKISYLTALREIAGNCKNAEAFKAAVKEKYPAYSGENYLELTAGFFFPAR